MTRAFLTIFGISFASAWALACGGAQPRPLDPSLPPTATATPPGPTGSVPAPTATGSPTGTGPIVTGWPPLTPPPVGSGTASPVDANIAGPAVAPVLLLARTEAPGSAAAAAPLVGAFQEGQTLEQGITLSPGKCYSFVAMAAGPAELEIALVANTPMPGLAPFGSTKGTGLRTVLGARDACIKLAVIPFDVPAKWTVRATKGAGVVAAQAFVR